MQQTKCFVILDHFLPFYLTNNLKNQNFERLKKHTGDINILHKFTKSHDHMLYCSLDMARNRFNYFSFLGYFLPFYLPNSPKIQNLEKVKKTPMEISSFYQKSWSYMLHCSWDMVYDGCNYLSFWAIFCPFIPLKAQKIKILKKWKKHLEISSFYICVPKIMIR